ncbi:MAG: isochorismatase family protein [Candidatus Niyogibacteria bacterium]|nr:isochorismatase family protein [Candidatus Niyogibacteria bacterium]
MGMAVLVIDMQDHFLRSVIDDVNVLINNQIKVLHFCAEHAIPVAILEYHGDGPTISALQNKINEVPWHKTFIKLQDDGFSNPELTPWLKERDVDRLVLMGVNSCFCVKQTALGGKLHGFEIATSSALVSCPHEAESREHLELYFFAAFDFQFSLDQLFEYMAAAPQSKSAF